MRVTSSGLLLLCACGRIAFDVRADAPLVAPIDSRPVGPFGQPTLVVSTGGDDDDPTLTQDQLELYFETSGSGDDIFVMRRADLASAWSMPVVDPNLSMAIASDGTPELSRDGLTMFIASDRPPSMLTDIWTSTRADLQAPWGAPTQLVGLSSPNYDSDPGLSASGLELVIIRAGAQGYDLLVATRPTTTSPWSTPTPITELNSPANEYAPCFANGDLELWFASDRADLGGLGQTDVYVATRPAIGQPFALPQLVTELSTPLRDEDPWLSPDGHTLFFARGNTGTLQVFAATR